MIFPKSGILYLENIKQSRGAKYAFSNTQTKKNQDK